MAGKNNDVGADIRMSALLLSALIKATDDELDTFVEKRSLDIDGSELRRVRDLLRELGALLKDSEDERWSHVLAAHRAIVGGEAEDDADEEAPDDIEETEPPDEPAQKPSLSDHPDIELPPSIENMLGAPEPPESIGSYPPSPWAEPTRAAELKARASSPLIAPPPVSDEPVPPSLVVPNATEPEMDASPDEEEGEENEEEEQEEHDVRHKTLPPAPMGEEVLPFASAPNPETPNSKSLPPPALASVIAGLPPMTVVSYAALCASCQAMPQRVAETHAKFGVTDGAARDSLDAVWKAKLAEDDRLHALWAALTDQFRSWLLELR
jgi:hypothetical protein